VVGDAGYGINRQLDEIIDSPDDQRQGQHSDHEFIPDGKINGLVQYGVGFVII